MGNFLPKATHTFPCQMCYRVFERELSGSLLCPECRIYNHFCFQLDYDQQYEKLTSPKCSTYPTFQILNKKEVRMKIGIPFCESWSKTAFEQMKYLSFEKEYILIKYIVEFFEKSDLIQQNIKGIYIRSRKCKDILFIYDLDVKESDKIFCIDIDNLVSE